MVPHGVLLLTGHAQLEDHVVPVGEEADVPDVGEVVVVGEDVLVAIQQTFRVGFGDKLGTSSVLGNTRFRHVSKLPTLLRLGTGLGKMSFELHPWWR